MSFAGFFFQATTGNFPYYYRSLLAGCPDGDHKPETLCEGTTCQPQLINIPTGLGKAVTK